MDVVWQSSISRSQKGEHGFTGKSGEENRVASCHQATKKHLLRTSE
jgi:hypothetical protein